MRLLPCDTCRQPALATRSGILHSAGSFVGDRHTYLCRRCGRNTTITNSEFQSLPLMTADELASSSCDLPWPLPDTHVTRSGP